MIRSHFQRFFALVGIILCSSAPSLAQAPKPRTILLVDDQDILYRSGTQRVLHPAKRQTEDALISQTEPWEVAIAWNSIYHNPDTGKYQLWYQAYAGHRAGDKKLECLVCYAESDDGIHFTKPALDLFPFKEHAKTNIVLIGSGGYGDRYCNSVLVDPREPDPARRYKMAYYDWPENPAVGHQEPGLQIAFSPDGIHWTKHHSPALFKTSYGLRGIQPYFAGENPYKKTPGAAGKPDRQSWAYPLCMADAVDVFYDPRCSAFVIYGKMWMDGPDGALAWKHGMGRIESKDLLTWSKAQFILGPDDQDDPETEFHTSPVFFYNDRYFCLNQIFNRRLKGAIDIELMTSRDGYAWNRSLRHEFFLARSKQGLFDSRSIFTNSTPVFLDDQIRFYYGAYNQSPVGGVKSEPGQRSGVGMAWIPRDRFAGVKPVPVSSQPTLKKPLQNIGQITFKPLDLTGVRQLTINAQTTEGGSIRPELLTDTGYRLHGFTKDDAAPIQGDSLRHPAAWKDKKLSDLPPGQYILRLHLDNATVYAVTLQ
jgi:hypothetical protein